ncbi:MULTISPECIES: hypothetical protein [Pseudomonas]|uniref:Uncharacterized protein n=2 Tax=Pseudomonas TaxID=286 RepID=A0A7X1GHK7_9PSED|nr:MULTISPECIES: hypothetical protein [Pseudomonas]MBC2692611.1 hypothetical protein [Pseudomonas kielensis]MDD1009347.1 hypothetical protein [Pseudomonas shahriarae]
MKGRLCLVGGSAFLIMIGMAAQTLALVPEVTIQADRSGYPIIYGKTNMPDGTLLTVTLRIPGQYGGMQNVEVVNGRFASTRFSVEGRPLPSGKASVEVSSHLPQLQSQEVRAVIGQRGENLEGPLVYSLPGIGGRMIKTTSTLQVP